LEVPWQLDVAIATHGVVGSVVQVQYFQQLPRRLTPADAQRPRLSSPSACTRFRKTSGSPSLPGLSPLSVTCPRYVSLFDYTGYLATYESPDADFDNVRRHGHCQVQGALQLGRLHSTDPGHLRKY
jgi:hypothetical protein